jgi:hypothetical protein
MAKKKSRAKRKQQIERQRAATTGSPSIKTAALSAPGPASLVAEPSDALLFFSELELDFFRRGDELDRLPARPASEDEPLWDWGAEATLTKTRVA